MQTTTIYRETLTITTDDDGARTVTRHEYADTNTEFYFTELAPKAQARAIRDAIEEENRTAYEWGSQTYFATEEIWRCAEDFTKQQPVRIYQDYGCSYCGEARARCWGEAWEEVTKATDNGWCYSMDICDVWNKYAVRIIALQEAAEEATDRACTHDDNADSAADNGDPETAEAERRRAAFYGDMAERIVQAAEELTEEAARAVGNEVDGLIEGEHDYYTSAEFWREWLNDGETRFTRDGERI